MVDVLPGMAQWIGRSRLMNAGITLVILLIGIGLLMIITGLLHLIPAFNRWDARTFQILYTRLRPYTGFFRFIWPLGTTPVGITLILIIFIASWQAGLIAALVYLLAVIVERFIKFQVKRTRPFEALPNVEMSQPKTPRDPSHPSGDTMRVWFLALVFPLAFGLHWPVYGLTVTAAATLSIGRIVLGVHYPLDVISGTGLGLITVALAVIIYQLAVIV